MPDDLTAIKKLDQSGNPRSPDSWRLNFANFGTVYKGPFAVGTISDFQKVQDDPIQVKSMVKVKGDAWGESDYIPLWFKPKDQYWDTPDHKATDFNQDGLYYENAWMSLRGGDEVAVLLQEGIPKVAIKFADGVPRIGEDLIHIESVGHEAEVQMNPHDGGNIGDLYGGDWDLNMKGPDGKDLKMVTVVQPQLVETLPDQVTYSWVHIVGGYGIIGDTHYYVGGTTNYSEWFNYYWKTAYTITPKLYAILIPIGAILYSIRYVVIHNHSVTELWVNQGLETATVEYPLPFPDNYNGADPPDIGGSWSKTTWASERGRSSWPSGLVNSFVFDHTTPSGENWYQAYGTLVSNGQQTSLGLGATPNGYNQENDSTDDWITNVVPERDPLYPEFNVGAAVNKPELTDPMSSDFIKQTILSSAIISYLSWWIGSGDSGLSDIESMVIKVRPHTKAELQAAGMWPWDN